MAHFTSLLYMCVFIISDTRITATAHARVGVHMHERAFAPPHTHTYTSLYMDSNVGTGKRVNFKDQAH